MLGNVISFLKRFGGAILRGIKWVAKQFVENRAVIRETAKAGASVATVGTTLFLAVKTIVDGFRTRKDGKKKHKGGFFRKHVNSNGKVTKRGNTKKKKSKSSDVIVDFREKLNKSSKFYKSLTPDEQKQFDKLVKRVTDKGTTKYDAFDLESMSFHEWNPSKSLCWNEWQEVIKYCEILSLDTETSEPIKVARQAIIDSYETRYRTRYGGKSDYTGINADRMSDAEKAKYKLQAAIKAEKVREDFDISVEALVKSQIEHDGPTQQTEEDQSVNPTEGASTLTGAQVKDEFIYHGPIFTEVKKNYAKAIPITDVMPELGLLETEKVDVIQNIMQDPLKEPLYSAKHMGDNLLDDEEESELVIRNVFKKETVPSYYVNDPQPPELKPNETREGFISILAWKPGMPHEYGQPEEIEHDYDWSEFSGLRAHPEISSIEDAYVSKGAMWCNENLECAHVFNDLYFQRPCIFPNDRMYDDFVNRFRRCYWDLAMIVPGLGDYGKVFAHPFLGDAEDVEITQATLAQNGLLTKEYGLIHPPSPEKVIYEILHFSSIMFAAKLEELKRNFTGFRFEIQSRFQLADLYYQAILQPDIVDSGFVDLNLYHFLAPEFEEFELDVDFNDIDENEGDEEYDPIDPVKDGIVLTPDELDEDD